MNEESEIQQEEVSGTALRLAQAIQELMEEYVPDFPEEVPEQIVHLSNQINLLERRQEQSLRTAESIKQLLGNIASTNNLLEKAGDVNLLLGGQHYDEHIIEPMLRSLFPIFDLITDYCRHHNLSDNKTNSLISAIYSQLQQFASNYDIRIIKHTAGDSFNPKTMKPVSWKETPDKNLENYVAQSLQVGFTLGKTKILRLETVSLFKYQPSKNNTNQFIERVEK